MIKKKKKKKSSIYLEKGWGGDCFLSKQAHNIRAKERGTTNTMGYKREKERESERKKERELPKLILGLNLQVLVSVCICFSASEIQRGHSKSGSFWRFCRNRVVGVLLNISSRFQSSSSSCRQHKWPNCFASVTASCNISISEWQESQFKQHNKRQ